MNNNLILIKNGYVDTRLVGISNPFNHKNFSANLATVVNNFVYYGFIPSEDLLGNLQSMSEGELGKFWSETENLLKEVTGANKEMEKFVVYKNFPKEVLEMSSVQYWSNQILIYFGYPVELFQDEKEVREELKEKKSLKVLNVAKYDTLDNILFNLLNANNRWTEEQKEIVESLFKQTDVKFIDISKAKFKENVIGLASKFINEKLISKEDINITNATDVLRLAAGMSEGDIGLKKNFKFKKFTRSERKLLLEKLENSNNLLEDVVMRAELFKKLFKNLHPGDYSCEKVNSAYNTLYNKDYITFNAQVLATIQNKDVMALSLLKTKPGEFFRKFHHLYATYANDAVDALKEVVSKFSVLQLVKLSKYVETINDRKFLMYAPNGNWTKVKVEKNEKVPFFEKFKINILEILNEELRNRLAFSVSEGVNLDEKTKNIKLQTNDQELANYGRGTIFDIPENVKFIRTASFWKEDVSHTFYDNSWNFFDENWNDLGVCNWNHEKFPLSDFYKKSTVLETCAVFSGDAINSKENEGKACQMIDLYLDKLEENGVRYALWSVLSFNKIAFEKSEVLATLQYGENPEAGNLYEPSRAQVVFPLKGEYMAKYISYIDIKERKLVYVDANFKADVSSASANSKYLAEKMPAYLEYLNALPSVYDLFKNAPKGEIPVLYSDKDIKIETSSAYVFKKENVENSFEDFSINSLFDETIKKEKKLKY